MSTPDENNPKPQGEPADLGEAGKRAIAAERARADTAERALAEATTKLQAYVDAGITDPVATKAQIETLTTENTTLNADLGEKGKLIDRLNVGIDKGLSRPLIERLKGDDADALTADADSLLALIPTDTKPPIPKADPSQGPTGAPAGSTPEQQFAGFLSNQLAR